MVSRAERNPVADWWFTVDKLLLIAFLALIFGGIVLSLAASPAVAERNTPATCTSALSPAA